MIFHDYYNTVDNKLNRLLTTLDKKFILDKLYMRPNHFRVIKSTTITFERLGLT